MKSMNRIAWLLILVFLTGCSALTPETYQLEQIHQNYTEEWAEWSADDLPIATPNQRIANGKDRFKKTLAGIKNYKQMHSDTIEAAHLTVLEGMIYLQSGKPGMASLLSPEVKSAREKLKSATGVATRDYLFADCYDELTNGWGAIDQAIKEIDTKPPIPVSKKPIDFSRPADDISDKLSKISKKTRAAAKLDSGGAYVATSAAIFYLWAYSLSPANPDFNLMDMAKKGENALLPWLSFDEICAVENKTYNEIKFDWGSRRRYLEWYEYLHKKSGAERRCPYRQATK